MSDLPITPALFGAELFHGTGCEYCHAIAANSGHRDSDLTSVADQFSLRILIETWDRPSFAAILKPQELTAVVAFLKWRNPAAQTIQRSRENGENSSRSIDRKTY